VKIVIFDVGGRGGPPQECQSEEFAEQETRDYKSSGVADAVKGLVGERVDIGGVERDFGVFDGLEGRDIGQVLTMEYAHTVTALCMTWQENANHFEVVLGWGVQEVVLDSSLGRQLVKCKTHPAVRHNPAKGVCPVRLAEHGHSPSSFAVDVPVLE
jgi:hypothetical protein